MRLNRRDFIVSTGTAGIVGLAGCSGGGDGGGGDGGQTTTTTGDGGGGETTTAGGTTTQGQTEPLTIGSLNPYSGNFSWIGANTTPAINMVKQTINDNGGINGRQVEIVKGDTAGTPDSALPAAKRLINVENVQALIGPSSLTIFTVIDIAKQNNVPIISPTAGTTQLNQTGGEYVFRTVPSDSFQGRGIAVGVREKKYNGIKSFDEMTIMVSDTPNQKSMSGVLEKRFEELGGNVVETVTLKPGKGSYSSEVGTMMNAGAGIAAVLTSMEDSVKILRAAFQAGYEGHFFAGVDVSVDETLTNLPDKATDGMLGVQSGTYEAAKESGRLQKFTDRLQEFAGMKPKAFTRNAYDAMNIVSLAAKQAEVNGSDVVGKNIAKNIPTVAKPPEKKVTSYLQGSSALEGGADVNYDGLIGPMDFNQYGNVFAPIGIIKAQGDSWNQVGSVPVKALS